MSIGSDGSTVLLRDVTLRDGLQLTSKSLPTGRKIALVRQLLALGVPELEIGSMARPDVVPAMADTLDVIGALTPEELERCWIWVATPRHVERAAAAGARRFQYCFSASDAHNLANIGRTTEQSMAAMPSAVQIAQEYRAAIQLCVATAFTCPFEGPVDPERVLAIATDERAEGAQDIVVCDTIGQAIPTQVGHLVAALRDRIPDRRIVFHGHDTWGLGVANSLAAIAAGAAMVDGSLGGLGGCPFAPGASGNTSSEDLLFATRPEWLDPLVFADVVGAGESLLADLGEPNRSRAAQGARSESRSFEWVIGAAHTAPPRNTGGRRR
jgi:hydroxymethylglutaryl-CoA lyase